MPDASANYRGIRCLLIATTCLALNDTCNKFLVATMPASEIVLLRAIISAIIVVLVIAARGELASLNAIRRPDIMLRSLAESWIGPFLIIATALFSIVAGIVLALFFPWATPVAAWKWPSAVEFALLATASGLFYLGVTYSYEAYRGSDLSVVASFRYWYLLVAIAAGFIVFGEVPGAQSLLGMAIIVAAGVLVVWQQRISSKA